MSLWRAGSFRSRGLALDAGSFRNSKGQRGKLSGKRVEPFMSWKLQLPACRRATATDYKSQAALRRRAPGAILVGGAD